MEKLHTVKMKLKKNLDTEIWATEGESHSHGAEIVVLRVPMMKNDEI